MPGSLPRHCIHDACAIIAPTPAPDERHADEVVRIQHRARRAARPTASATSIAVVSLGDTSVLAKNAPSTKP